MHLTIFVCFCAIFIQFMQNSYAIFYEKLHTFMQMRNMQIS